MSAADSISIFAEGTFEDQVTELITYISRGKSEEEQAAFLKPFQDALQGDTPIAEDEGRRRKVVTMLVGEVKTLGEGSEKEIEGFFNLLFAHLFTLWSADSPEIKSYVTDLVHVISSSAAPDSSPKYKILANLFNALPRRSPLRLPVYNAMLHAAAAKGDLTHLNASPAEIDVWMSEWDISAEEKTEFLKSLAQAYSADQQTSYTYTLAYLRALPASSPDAQQAAESAIAQALRLPSLFDFDPLFKIESVLSAKDTELFALLHIFLNDSLPEFTAWADAHSAVLETHGLHRDKLEHKMRLLTLASLGFQNVGKDLPYSSIVSALQIDPADVEKWAIEVIRAQLLSGKLSQTTQTLRVQRASARAFERAQWAALEQRMIAWKAGLAAVLDVVARAREDQKKGRVPVTKAQAQEKEEEALEAVAAAA